MNLNKTIALGSALLLFGGLNAQKAKVVSAYNYNKSFERDKECSELVKGIESIEPATKDEKTSSWAKTWYYGGNLYFNVGLNPDEECAAKFPGAIDKSYEYYIKSILYNIQAEGASELDLEKQEDQYKFVGYLMNRETSYEDVSYTRDIMANKFPYLANAFVNKGVEEFNAGNHKNAKEYSLKSVQVNGILGRVDSLGMYNAALAAEQLEEDEEAIQLYTMLTQINYGGPDIFMYMANIHGRNQDTAKKIEAIRAGLEKYPENADLIREELSHLLVTGQTEEALNNFDKAIEKDPENPSLYYNRGLIYDQLQDYDKAEVDYKKALEVDPKFFDAIYNLGAMYYNAGVEWNNKASSYTLNETDKFKVANEKANTYFTKAKPALEKAHELNPEDRNTMASLVQIYARLGEDELWSKMREKLGAN